VHFVIAWNSVDFPTLANPTWRSRQSPFPSLLMACPTYDTTLEIVSWPTEQDLLLFHSLFGRHLSSALCVGTTLCGEGKRGE
jgi:hypothetical protein